MGLATDARNRYGAIKRHHPNDVERITAARAELAEAKLADYIEKVVADAPPLDPEAVSRLALLLRPIPSA